MTTKKKDSEHRCEYTHKDFKYRKTIAEFNQPIFRDKRTNRCWVRETKKYSDKHLCIFHMPEDQEDDESQKLQASTLQRLIGEWNADDKKNSFIMIGMRCGELNLDNIVFKSTVVFNHAIFNSDASFENTTFYGNVSFENATFKGIALFEKATFECEAMFNEVTFMAEAWYEKVKFKGFTKFEKAKFKNCAWFDEAEFICNADFNNAIFSSGTTFKKARIENGPFMQQCKFKKAPSFHDVEISQGANFRGAIFSDVISYDAASFYRTLKVAMNKSSNKMQEAIFYGLEQKSLRNQPETSLVERFFSRAYEIFANYGQSITRPLVSLVGAYLIFFQIYMLFHFPVNRFNLLNPLSLDTFLNKSMLIIKFITLQIVSPFKVWSTDYIRKSFGEDISLFKEFALSLVATFQSLVCLIIITLLVLAIRRNFKLS